MTDKRLGDNVARTKIGRRNLLRATGGMILTGVLAGCSGNGDGDTGNGDGDSENTSVDEWLSSTDNYDSVTDMTGKDAVTVEVGPSGNEYVFEPAAIRIDPGTTVTWQWVGSGHHNVVATDGGFKSGPPEKEATFEHTFDSAGKALYYCQPHKSMGMKGAVVVGSSDEGTDDNN
ncbi:MULTISPECIES: halocyanin domain-containing protein [unclassified Haladaptatus]|uniref:halocyanin domain-containing protein n=1 Tax=unclassified Haladaptatus TaxID=2622732 RepID=UPI00209C303A|nr:MULTISPECIES: halocyanin domain-containing protein [unclassified Haladaptatus]MCO8243078.1 halocyanin domain-containing protein [Haladaptatus sp. AB643]MCO8252792.1 halocyanin domain-containing protein [Haladaptatus sp. AB618]